MKAAVIREHGGADVIGIEDLPGPEPGPGEIVVEVRAGALNHLDIWVRKGGRAELKFPHIVGSDAAGVVAALGEGTEGVEVGREVVIVSGYGCGACEFCRQGEVGLCESFGIIGLSRPGVFAERAVVPAGSVVPKPASLDFRQAACLGVAYGTAWRMLFTRAALRPGESVLVHGIGGGVALAALQFVKAAGARAIVTSSSDEKLAKARQMGAAETINYSTTSDVAAAVHELTDGRGVDVAFDSVGAATWPIDMAATRKGGRVVICGVTSGAETTISLQTLYWRQLSLLGSTFASKADFLAMLRTLETAGIEPAIDTVLPIEKLADAHRRMEEGKQFGKIVVTF
jgi:NADPH:quinone reductase-like Zn-dependent oxidoreductase